jgi:glycosyltransferase involved in cell wall biosynthesis
MKILVYTDYYKKKSGYAAEFRNLLPHFRAAGHDVAHVALGYHGFPIEEGLRTYPARVIDVESYWAPQVLQYAIEDFDPDIVFTLQDYYVLPKIAFEMAHPGKHKWVHWGLADGDPLDFTAIEPCRWVNQHIFHTDFAKNVVKDAVPEIDGPVIYSPVDTNIFKKLDKPALRKQYKLENRKTILNVARPQLRKALPTLLESFKKVLEEISDAVLILAVAASNKTVDPFTGSELLNHDMEKFVPMFGLSDNVLMPKPNDGRTPIDDEVLNIQYNLADINVLTSWGEGFGLPIIEAGAVGIPTVGVDCSAMTEVIGDRGLLVKPRAYTYTIEGVRQYLAHPSDISSAMVTLLRDEKMIKEQGDKAFAFAQTLTPESRAKEILQVFEDTINNDVQPVVKR